MSFRLEHVYRHSLNPVPLRMLKHVLRCLSPLYRMEQCLYRTHSCFCIHQIISRLLKLPTKTLWSLNHIIQGILKRKWQMNTVNIGVIFSKYFWSLVHWICWCETCGYTELYAEVSILIYWRWVQVHRLCAPSWSLEEVCSGWRQT